MKTDKQTILDAARQYLSKGYSVIPLKPKGKTPAIPSWKEFQNHKPTDKELTTWFLDGKLNIGIVTGKLSGLTVVDFDTPEAVEQAKQKGFPKGPLVKTARGFHAYCKYEEGHRNFQKKAGLPGIDFRGEGGYVVAPPSIHESGHVYQWVDDRGLDLPLPDAPDWLFAKTDAEKIPIADLYDAKTGSRNESLTRLLGSWLNDHRTLTLPELIDMASLWNKSLSTPLTLEELTRTCKSIYDKHHEGDLPEAIKTPPFGEAANIPLWIDTEPLKREELFEGFLIKGIVGGLFAQGGVGKTFFLLCLMISAALGRPLFKSFRPAKPLRVLAVLGEDPSDEIHRRLRSIFQEYGDISSELLTQNLQLYCGKGAPLMQFANGNPTATAAFKWLKIMVEEFNPDLIFIDPKSMFYGLDENQNDHNTQWVIMLRELTAWGASVVYSHHVTKAMAGSLELNGARGGSALVDGSRLAANMRQLADEDSKRYDIDEPWRYVEFKVTKNSYIPKLPGSIFFKFTTGGALEEVDLQATREYLLVEDLLSALTSEAVKGNYPSRREIEREGNILPDHTQRDRKKAVELALNAGHIITEKDGVKTILRLNSYEVVQVVQDACADLII